MSEPQHSPNDAARHALPSALIHELRTPLNHIIGYSELLMEQGHDDFVSDLEKIRAAGQQLLGLINDNFLAAPASGPPAATETRNAERGTRSEEADEVPRSAFRVRHSEMAQGSVLVVDDIEANRDVLSRQLHRQGHVVSTAENGRQSLEMLRAQTFDLVLLDIMMPEMDGYEVLQRLQADEALRHFPVIMISALSELDSVVRCIELGAVDYLTKPFNPILLKARIGACLERKRARDRETHLFQQLQGNYRRLQELEKLRDDLTHMIIHDLRTPLNAMFLGMQAFEAMGEFNEAQGKMLGMAMESGNALVGLINDLLDISKMESGSLQLDRRTVMASDLIEAAVKQIAPLARARDLTLTKVLETGLPPLMADGAKLLRTLVNLLSNAIKFTPPGGTVNISVRQSNEGPALRFCVSDTGEGIPSDAFGRIFEKFGQVESRQGGRSMSTGLGLAFCKLAVEAHDGRIGVESTPGEGSTFSFTIPLPSPPDVGPEQLAVTQ